MEQSQTEIDKLLLLIGLSVYYYTVGITVTYLLIYECIIFPHKTQMKLELPSYQIQGYLLY